MQCIRCSVAHSTNVRCLNWWLGSFENLVRIPLNHPQRLEPQYVYGQVLQWRKPRVDPSRELASHLQDISKDCIHAITNCVGQMVNTAVTSAERDARAETKRVAAFGRSS
jgi:hypothetical protein